MVMDVDLEGPPYIYNRQETSIRLAGRHSSLVKNGRHLLGSVDDVNVIEFVPIKLNERSMIS
jgi:hypothetical protein